MNELFNKLIEKYNLRAITIDKETWYGINDLPIRETRKTFSDLRKQGLGDFVEDNTRTIKPSDISAVLNSDTSNSAVCSTDTRNFDTVNNFGETFGNFKMVNYLIMNSRLGAEYKIDLIEILEQIKVNGYYIAQNINSYQLDKLQAEVNELKAERTKKVYGSTEIVRYIKVKGLLSSALLRYMDEVADVGDYTVAKVNRTFKYNEGFIGRCCATGLARVGVGGRLEFYKEFADAINNCAEALKELERINMEELDIKNKGIEKRLPF